MNGEREGTGVWPRDFYAMRRRRTSLEFWIWLAVAGILILALVIAIELPQAVVPKLAPPLPGGS